MDISKIISNSIDKAAKDAAVGKFSTYPTIGDETVDSLTAQDALLMNYTNILLTAYHEELRKSLAEQGIKI